MGVLGHLESRAAFETLTFHLKGSQQAQYFSKLNHETLSIGMVAGGGEGIFYDSLLFFYQYE